MREMVLAAGRPLIVASGGSDGRVAAFSALSDEALMSRFCDGDPQAFEMLYRRHRAGLHRFVRRLAPNDTEEIFQDVWLAVIKGKRRYAPTARFVTYLFTIAHHRAVERLRKRRRRPQAELSAEDDGEVPDGSPNPLNIALNAELGKALADAIALLPLAQREAFLMQAEGGLSLDEIAEASGASRETVKSRLRYANRRLRLALESWK